MSDKALEDQQARDKAMDELLTTSSDANDSTYEQATPTDEEKALPPSGPAVVQTRGKPSGGSTSKRSTRSSS